MNLRELERTSIRSFLQHCADAGYFNDCDVLDFGCGQQPYRDIITFGGGRYSGWDSPRFPAATVKAEVGTTPWAPGGPAWDVIVCTQVVQYIESPRTLLVNFLDILKDAGVLVITWPTNWPEVEIEDLHRFTQAGMARMLYSAGYASVDVTPRAFLEAEGSTFYLGHGAIACKS